MTSPLIKIRGIRITVLYKITLSLLLYEITLFPSIFNDKYYSKLVKKKLGRRVPSVLADKT